MKNQQLQASNTHKLYKRYTLIVKLSAKINSIVLFLDTSKYFIELTYTNLNNILIIYYSL